MFRVDRIAGNPTEDFFILPKLGPFSLLIFDI
jgi:hypothetical protein